MDLRHLDLLRELDDRGSLAAVARSTRRTPSAVSQQLRTAERAFGVPLAEPAGRGLRLTDAGRLLADCGRDVAAAVARAEARWADFRGRPAGTVTVAALPSAATFLLPPVLRDLEGVPIDVSVIDVDVAEAEYGALARDVDIVIAHSLAAEAPVAHPRLVSTHLVREPLDIAMSPDHPLARHPEVTPDQVAACAWIGVPAGYPFDSVLLAIKQATGRALDVRQRVRDNRLVEALVAGGDRLAVLPRFTTPTGAGIVLRPLAGIPTGRHVFALQRPDRAERRAAQRVLDALRRVAASFSAPEAGRGRAVPPRPTLEE